MTQNLFQKERYYFIDLFSDFKAMLDTEGVGKVTNIFTKNIQEFTDSELEIAQTLVNHGLLNNLEELSSLRPPELRTNSLLSRLEIEVTKKCNISCQHCFTEKLNSDFNINFLEKSISDFEKLGVVEIVLNGGEIFLHKEISKILSLLNNRFKVILYSNGTLEGSISHIINNKIARVNISLDGFEESHEYMRGKGTYKKTINTIKELMENGVPIQINSMVYHKNNSDLEKFIDFCRNTLKVQSVKLSTIYPLGEATRHPELFKDSSLTREIYEKYLKEDTPGMTSDNFLPCLAGITKLFINTFGEIYPCRLYEDKQFIMGSLDKDSFGDIYNNFIKSDNYFTQFSIDKLETCNSCPALEKCKTGCRARAYLMENGLYGPDKFSCENYLSLEK